MSLFDSDCGFKRTRKVSKCEGCICDLLCDLNVGTEVDIFLKGTGDGEEIMDLRFVSFDCKTCCVTFVEDDYPFIVDCRNIVAIRFRND